MGPQNGGRYLEVDVNSGLLYLQKNDKVIKFEIAKYEIGCDKVRTYFRT